MSDFTKNGHWSRRELMKKTMLAGAGLFGLQSAQATIGRIVWPPPIAGAEAPPETTTIRMVPTWWSTA